MLKYFKIITFMLFGHVIARLIFRQQFSNEMILEIFLASIFTAFFWWLYDWSTSKEIKSDEE